MIDDVFTLDDLDTAFPRDTSTTMRLKFANGHSLSVTTNASEEEFKEKFVGKRIGLWYYRRESGDATAILLSAEGGNS